ncbi:unnamed protein product [Pleuronectes platessa]|uniref:Uncharacterized protein n=1 Tax=Pleuronectes platessa TaxID=8262 RepID=A0A9N7Y0A1_PLEPL|nr:unnamed protein product [Pleuronectes platessa]
MKKLCCKRRVRESITDPEVETTSQYGSSEETVVSERIKSVEEIIEKEVSQFTDVILDVVPDAEFTLLQSQSRLEIKNAADAIVRFAARTEQTESAGTSPERIDSADSVKRRIKNFIVETLGKAYIHRIVAKIRARFHPTATAKSKEELEALNASIDDVFLSKDDVNQNFSSGNNLTLAQELSDLLYIHITPPTYNSPVPKSEDPMLSDIWNRVINFLSIMDWVVQNNADDHSNRVAQALMESGSLCSMNDDPADPDQIPSDPDRIPSDPNQYPSDPKQSTCDTEESTSDTEQSTSDTEQSTSDTEQSTSDTEQNMSDPEQSMSDFEPGQVDPDQSSSDLDQSQAEPDLTSADPEQNAAALTQNNNAFIRILVIRLMMKTLDQAKMVWIYFQDPQATIQRLIENILADVEDAKINITAEKVASLQAPIFKDLSKKFGSATGLLAAMEAGDTEVEKCIALLLIGHLTKQRGAIGRFFI